MRSSCPDLSPLLRLSDNFWRSIKTRHTASHFTEGELLQHPITAIFSRAFASAGGSGLQFSRWNPGKMQGVIWLAQAFISFQATLDDASFTSVVYRSSN